MNLELLWNSSKGVDFDMNLVWFLSHLQYQKLLLRSTRSSALHKDNVSC